MRLFVALFLLISSTALQAKTCDLSRAFNKKQLSSLKRAKKIKRVGPNGSLLGKNVYKVDVLSRDNDEQFLVLLGEAHIKGPRSSLIGKSLVKRFKVRMLEGIPKAEAEYIQNNVSELAGALGWQRLLARVITFNFFGSTITLAQKKGLTFLPGYDLVLVNKKKYKAAQTQTADDIIAIMKGILNINEVAEKGLNLPIEAGEFLKPSVEESYILHARNKRMVSNIVSYLESGLVDETPLAIVGSDHNKGMVALLETQGFEKCDNF